MKISVGEMTKDLSQFIGLKHTEDPKVEIDEKSVPEQSMMDLVCARLMPHHSEVPEDMIDLVRRAEKRGRFLVASCVVDLLGKYEHWSNRVILYDQLIRECGRKLGFDHADLQRVVLFHELAHQVTHRGLDAGGRDWGNFRTASRERKEYFAQLYAYKYARQQHWGEGTRIMAILSKHQSSMYGGYQKSIRLSMGSIYSQLMEERRKEPEILIIPPLPVVPDPEPSDQEKIQAEIDPIERGIMRYRTENHCSGTNLEVAEKLGLRTRYERLLKRSDEAMWAEESSHR